MGAEYGNLKTNSRHRVNSPEAALDPKHADRPEVRSGGMIQIELTDKLADLRGADLLLELWGGHPGTANCRVAVNGRSTHPLPTADDRACTHLHPAVPLKLGDLVRGPNAFQFACDQGTSFWGHFIVENATLRAESAGTCR